MLGPQTSMTSSGLVAIKQDRVRRGLHDAADDRAEDLDLALEQRQPAFRSSSG